MEDDSRSYKGIVPETNWMSRRTAGSIGDGDVRFMTTQARPPSKRERPMKLNMGAKNLKQTVKNVIKEKKAQHKMLMMRDKSKRGRPSGAMNPTKKRLVAARYA